MKILIVDDDRYILKYLARWLATHGHEALVAASGAEALAICGAEPVDLVLSDLHMAGMNGVELAAELRLAHGVESPPVIIMTASSPPANAADVVAVIQKPLDLDRLLDFVERVHNSPPTAFATVP